jgi:N-alpha-acetyltransferase 35, NatC auxiliary subunit
LINKQFIFYKQKIFGEIELNDFIKKYIYELPSLSKYHYDLLNNSQNVQDLPEWLGNYGRCFILVIYSLLNNRSRCRRRISNLIVEFFPLHLRAESFDSENPKKDSLVFTNITIELTSYLMKIFLEMGFELSLYQKNEYFHIFWYWDYISGVRYQRIRKLYAASDFVSPEMKKKKKKMQQIIEAREMLFEGEYLLIRGISRFLSFFVKQGSTFNKYPFAFGSEKITYEHRFAPFSQVIQPQILSFENFQELTKFSKYTSKELLKSANDSFAQSKIVLERIHDQMKLSNETFEHSRVLLKIANANFISSKMCFNLVEMKKIPDPIFDFSTNSTFPIIKPKY